MRLDTLFQFTHPGRGATVLRTRGYGALWSFNSRTPGGVRPYSLRRYPKQIRFQFTHPGRGATPKETTVAYKARSFNSRTPGGVRREERHDSNGTHRFQFTHPGRGATEHILICEVGGHVSIHAPREGCDFLRLTLSSDNLVSIHAPREGCDQSGLLTDNRDVSFNSRTPGGVRPKWVKSITTEAVVFQFTHPGRGATPPMCCPSCVMNCFNSRTPGGVRPNAEALKRMREQFQFTHPGRGATFRILVFSP